MKKNSYLCNNKILNMTDPNFLKSLVNKPIIRDDYSEEFLNKMTDAEIEDWEHDVKTSMIKDKIPEKYPDWGSAYTCRVIDSSILYQLFKESENVKKGL